MGFDDFLNAHPGVGPELPLVHSTNCVQFAQMQATGVLAPQDCPVFGEPLLYFFYGRPVYRPSKRGATPDTRYDLCPVCFVFKPGALGSCARVFPFDSGALDAGLFDPPIARADRDNYSLAPVLQTAQRLVEVFFETNGQYYLGEPRKVFAAPAGELEIERYWQLITSSGEADFDERRSAIEVQCGAAVTLRDNLHAVIMPAVFLDEPEVCRAVAQEWRAIPLTYETYRGAIPNEYTRVIAEKLRKLFAAYF